MERWKEIESLFQEALNRPAAERDTWLRQRCKNDSGLLREVESLLTNHGAGNSSEPWAAAAAAQLIGSPGALAAGQQLGPYRISSFIAAGGMGSVYRAHDPRTGRDVAVKVAGQQFNERFSREIRAVAALNHPNICTLYDVGPNYLVMELVEGETPKGSLPLETVLNYARQIADALEAAHEKGIVHRDLKPGNIKVRADGTVKVLDFGLAQVSTAAGARPDESPTISLAATQAGVILGTAAYMSPEQARGRSVDKRTDIWAFGVVLYELLTGKTLFQGEDVTETLASVVKDQPDLSRVPRQVQPLLRRCLEKDPKKRLRDIADAMPILDLVATDAPPHPTRRAHRWLALALTLAGLFLLTSIILAIVNSRAEPPGPPQLIRFQVYPPEKTNFATPADDPPAVSPDGKRLAFIAAGQDGRARIWIRDLESVDARPLPGTEEPQYIFWSPDSRWIAFRAGGELRKIAISGGPSQTLCACFAVLHGAWSKNGLILFGNSQGIWKISENGGAVTQLTSVDASRGEDIHFIPSFLPDGRHFLYVRSSSALKKGEATSGTYVGSLDAKPSDQSQTRLFPVSAAYVGSGLLLTYSTTAMMAQAFDPHTLKLKGEATPIVTDIRGGFINTASSTSGVVAYGGVGAASQLTWTDRKGKAVGTIAEPAILWQPRVSPDGETVAYVRYDFGPGNIWLYDAKHGAYQFTFGNDAEAPVWSPDGSHLAFFSIRGGGQDIYQKASNGLGDAVLLIRADRPGIPFDWSRDGNYIVFGALDPKTRVDVWVLPLAGDKKAFPYLNSEYYEDLPRLSPNGQWMAYESDRSGRFEVYVTTFNGAASNSSSAAHGDWAISTNGGTRPVWSRDGKELFFISADRKMMAVEVSATSSAKFDFTAAKPLFDAKISGNPWEQFDVSKDGRFLIPVPVQEGAGTPITVVVNWPSLLKH
jgi:serine/threonine protein kinase/Tol biopolymer transport system component